MGNPTAGRTTTTTTTTTPATESHDGAPMMLGAKIAAVVAPPTARTLVRVYVVRHGETHWNQRGRIQGGGYDVPLNDNGRDQAVRAARALRDIPLDVVASSSLSRAKETADIVWEQQQQQRQQQHRGSGSGCTKTNTKKPLRIVDPGFNEMRFGVFEGLRYKRRTHGNNNNTGESSAPTDDEPGPESSAMLDRFLVEKKKVLEDPGYRFPSRDAGGGGTTGASSSAVDADETEAYKVDDEFGIGESHGMVEDRSIGGLSRAIGAVLRRREDQPGGGAGGDDETAESAGTKHIAIVSHGRTNKVLLSLMMTGDVRTGYKGVHQSNANISVLDYTYDGPENGGDDADRLPSSWKGVWTARLLNYVGHI